MGVGAGYAALLTIKVGFVGGWTENYIVREESYFDFERASTETEEAQVPFWGEIFSMKQLAEQAT